ncbi:hypothetical protein CJ030_MR7G002266 [Morella rubra]|uniref:Uncharacterized protein n=1 Tax=Morella rubra TaxID=262757 RepID=A0A6A1V5U5_9ROSI|nr:hypothetical protein CJ030_MR7G002266 [Morella rubra]
MSERSTISSPSLNMSEPYEAKKNGHGGYFAWFDPPTCPHGMEFKPYLIKKVKALENEVDSLKHTRRSLKILLGGSWIALASLVFALLRCSVA